MTEIARLETAETLLEQSRPPGLETARLHRFVRNVKMERKKALKAVTMGIVRLVMAEMLPVLWKRHGLELARSLLFARSVKMG